MEYYIQKTGLHDPEMYWWAILDRGYTGYVDNAKRFTKEQALEIINSPNTNKIAWEADYINDMYDERLAPLDSSKLDQTKRLTP